MKYIKTILISLFITLSTYSQQETILPLNYDASFDVPEGGYIKDLNNDFNSYEGTWQGTWNGKIFILRIEKVLHQLHSFPNGYYYYRDGLVGKYKVTEIGTGSIIESTMDITNFQEAKIESLAYPKNNEFNFLYSDDNKCYNTGKFRLKGNPATNQLQYFYFYESFWISKNCIYTSQDDIPINIPTSTLTLTKVQ